MRSAILLIGVGAVIAVLFAISVFVAFVSLRKNSEADRAIQQYWDATLTKCGDDWYARSFEILTDYYQFNDITFSTAEQSLTEADRLNGIEWKANIKATVKAYRRHSSNGWAPWQQSHSLFSVDGLDVVATKIKGSWKIGSFSSQLFGRPTLTRIDCSQIPSQ